MTEEIKNLLNENTSFVKECNLCKDSILKIGSKDSYGAVVIYKIGDSQENSWFATLSPKTGSNPEKDFTIQLMPFGHFTHFFQIEKHPELAKNYGLSFSKLTSAMAKIMAEEQENNPEVLSSSISIATYGKWTNWKPKKEHLHIKLFPFRGKVGQPCAVDYSFAKKEIFIDERTGEEFVKMNPVRKVHLSEKRFKELSDKLIHLLK